MENRLDVKSENKKPKMNLANQKKYMNVYKDLMINKTNMEKRINTLSENEKLLTLKSTSKKQKVHIEKTNGSIRKNIKANKNSIYIIQNRLNEIVDDLSSTGGLKKRHVFLVDMIKTKQNEIIDLEMIIVGLRKFENLSSVDKKKIVLGLPLETKTTTILKQQIAIKMLNQKI